MFGIRLRNLHLTDVANAKIVRELNRNTDQCSISYEGKVEETQTNELL